MSSEIASLESTGTAFLSEPATRRMLAAYVRKRVPASDVDDVVQNVLCDALAATTMPPNPVEGRRWLLGVARNKIVDRHRSSGREFAADLPDIPSLDHDHEGRALADWAHRQAARTGNEATATLRWMTLEGDGEHLETIAEEAQLKPAAVRQRVSRLRRFLREQWRLELAIVSAALAVYAANTWWQAPVATPTKDSPSLPEFEHRIDPNPQVTSRPSEVAVAELRGLAQTACAETDWVRCQRLLEEARKFDPSESVEIRELRELAARNARPPEAPPKSTPQPNPTSTSSPPAFNGKGGIGPSIPRKPVSK